jgi:molybdenum cofactor biosynthesis enzyme MoaA
MHEMSNLESLTLFVGTGQCNARCAHCAGLVHRKYAPKEDGIMDERLIYQTLKECYKNGARHLSLTSSGEPTLSPLSVTRVLEIVNQYKDGDMEYSPVNIYSNGIRIGEDKEFCDSYLPLWKRLGLTSVYITVHDVDERENAGVYGIVHYPALWKVFQRIHEANLLVRANLVLGRNTISTFERFVSVVKYLREIGADAASAWPIRDADDNVDAILSPAEVELRKMSLWAAENPMPGFKIRVLDEKHQEIYQTGRKLTLFPDGTLSNSWCNH